MAACRYEGDATWVNFGAFRGEELVAIVSAHSDGAPGEWRIRGMAAHPSCQGQGAGGVALAALLAWLRERGVPAFWCNARERAIPFYERHGFRCVSELFEIEGIGPHKVMRREA